MSREILLLVDVLAREKNVTSDMVSSARWNLALASATKKRIARRRRCAGGGRSRNRRFRNLPPLGGGAGS
jgi:hypothetical protein